MPNNLYETEPQPAMPAQPTEEPAPTATSHDNESTGQLVVSTFTANQLTPVIGATISVTADKGESSDVLATSDTDRSGRSKTFTLPAPSAAMSQAPTAAIPFAEYTVTVEHPDYFKAVLEDIQIFGGIVTQLPVNLVPLPELPGQDTTRIIIIPRQNL